MLARCSALALVLLTATAAGEPAASEVPGTGGDPILALGVMPDIVDAPLVPKLVRRGVDDTLFLFDGFELPHMFHDGTRSIIAGGSLSELHATEDVGFGRGATLVEMTPVTHVSTSATATLRDLEATTMASRQLGVFLRVAPFDTSYATSYEDVMFVLQRRVGEWKYRLAGIAAQNTLSFSPPATVVRDVLTLEHLHGHWRTRVALALLDDQVESVHHESYDGRISTEYVGQAAGLRRIAWQAGFESLNGRHSVDDMHVIWTPDEAVWSRVTAELSPRILATAGIRIDAFTRSGDIATQPRASIQANVGTDSRVTLRAGAYRRPPEREEELRASYLHPERTTAIEAQYETNIRPHLGLAITGYYTDRIRLIVRDPYGALANTGFETAQGVEVVAIGARGPWTGYLSGSWSSARHHDFFRAADQPAQFDQPIRVDALVRYRANRWRISGRFELSSGLPYTPVVESSYDADADRYTPVYGLPYTARMPLHHELSIRADVRFDRHWSAFLDLHNAYAAQTAVRYDYSYDYKQRLAVTLPILPFVGIRGQL